MSLLLGLMLVVRLGIRAGEAELNNYWQLFKNLGDPAFICDVSGKIILSNPAFHHLETAEEGDMALTSIFKDIPETALESVSKDNSTGALEVNVRLEKGKTPYLLSLNPVVTESRQVLIAGVAHNMNDQIRQRNAIQAAYDELQAVHLQLEALNTGLEQKVAERTANLMDAYRRLEEQNKVLQELDQLKSDFVSLVSHELRNPLNNLGGGLELLLARPKSWGRDKGTLALMQAEVRRLTRFVESILDVSAIEAGRLELHPTSLSLVPILEHLSKHWGIPEDARRIQIEVPADLPKVIAAQTALESVLRHLVDNAIKYAPDGPVVVSASQQDGQVYIRVRDFGLGIPEDKRNLLFERFQRLDAKDSQSVYGYGLGLYLSRRLLEEMGSTLTFDTPADGGTQFSFSLKVAEKK
jgi:signal transduction histidine kinase